jgi:uncharacterized repeat protein (TIGR01451 family)
VESHPTAASPGGVITYRLIVANQGSTAAGGITVQNNLPAGVVLLSSSGTNGFGCGEPVSNGVMACTGGSVNGGAAATIDIVGFIDAPCVNPSPFVDAATVNPNQTIVESNYANNDGSAPTVVSGCPVLTVTPTGTTAPTVTLTQTGTPTAVASLTPTPTRTPTTGPSLTPTVTGSPSVDLAVSVLDSASDPVQSPGSPGNGGLINYTLVVTNTGANQATGVTVTDTLENGFVFACGGAGVSPGDQCNTSDPSASNAVSFVTAQGTGGFNCAPFTSGSPVVTSVVCNGGTVAANSGTTITISVATTAGCAFILNRAVADSAGTIAETNETNNVGYAQTACGAGASTPTPLATLTPTRTPGP